MKVWSKPNLNLAIQDLMESVTPLWLPVPLCWKLIFVLDVELEFPVDLLQTLRHLVLL